MTSLQLRNIEKSFNKQNVIHGVDLDINDGEFIVFVGPSGCGKSTLLRMIAGLEDISAGELKIGNDIVNDVVPAERGVAMVFQSYALYPHMSVFENMAFGLKQARTPKDEIDRLVRAAADSLQITDYLDRLPKHLSGGQRQRVAIGRAIVRDPRVFLFDEPLSNLDAALRVQTRIEIANLHKRLSATMIYVTHDQVVILRTQQASRLNVTLLPNLQDLAAHKARGRRPAQQNQGDQHGEDAALARANAESNLEQDHEQQERQCYDKVGKTHQRVVGGATYEACGAAVNHADEYIKKWRKKADE